MKFLFCFGTRPEWIKIKPVLDSMNETDYRVYFTGQHKDLIKVSEIKPDYLNETCENFKIKNRKDNVIVSCLANFPNDVEFSHVIVQGDTASAYGCAVAAYNRGIKVIHLEAGLRSFSLDDPYPEEGYRQMISRIADINFCPTQLSRQNLEKEGVLGKIYVVGNTVLDNLLPLKSKSSYGDKVLVTLHRSENDKILEKWLEAINRIASTNTGTEFIFIIHPRHKNREIKSLLGNVKILEPLCYSEFINALLNVKYVITDSGGVQEEGSFLNKKIVVCRETTERPEGITSGHLILCKEPKTLNKIVEEVEKNYEIEEECPYGDGKSSSRIVEILTKKDTL